MERLCRDGGFENWTKKKPPPPCSYCKGERAKMSGRRLQKLGQKKAPSPLHILGKGEGAKGEGICRNPDDFWVPKSSGFSEQKSLRENPDNFELFTSNCRDFYLQIVGFFTSNCRDFSPPNCRDFGLQIVGILRAGKAKHYGTPGSQVITRPSTGEAELRLSTQF